jgi:ribose 5-phosphate isomerase B
MKIAVCSDEPYPVHMTLASLLRERGHDLVRFGAFEAGAECAWASVAEQAATAVASGECAEGIFFCWSGTGICMAANKLPLIRAALCHDPGAARAARIWNRANVLCLSNRSLSDDMAKEILDAWFEPVHDQRGAAGAALLDELDRRFRRQQHD